MAAGVPLTDELWSNLYIGEPKIPKSNLSPSEWSWLYQVTKIRFPYSDLSDLLAPKITFALSNENYWIILKYKDNFPKEAPIVKCAYQNGFFFDWIVKEASGESSTLSSVISQYETYVTTFDDAVGELKSLEDDGYFSLIKYFIDEDDSDLLVVKFQVKDDSEIITAKINWKLPREFPYELDSSKVSRFEDIDCDQWDAESTLSYNFAKICGLLPLEDLYC